MSASREKSVAMRADGLCLLALDGGGIRGLSSLMILRRLMQTVDPDAPPKPCDYFDMIAGTSTGGLIAIMLGRLRMSVDECIDAYASLSAGVFEKKSHCVNRMGKSQWRFDAAELERSIKDMLVARETDQDASLMQFGAACKVFVCATSKQTGNTTCLRSYPRQRGGNLVPEHSTTIWQACRATSAASGFFDPIVIGPSDEEFVDGALGAINPVYQLWDEAENVWGDELSAKLKCMVSIGSGVCNPQSVQDECLRVSSLLAKLAAEADKTAQQFRRDRPNLDVGEQYFRFNVDCGLDRTAREESKRKDDITAAAREYVESRPVFKQLTACAGKLLGRESPGKRSFVSIPYCRNPDYIDRGDVLDQMERACLHAPHRVALVGLGGIGKSQLAIEFAHTTGYKSTHQWVFWVHAGTRALVDDSFRTIATALKLAGHEQPGANVPQLVCQWLSNERNGRWLLILDSADDQDAFFHAAEDGQDTAHQSLGIYLPQSPNGRIVITSRDRQLADRLAGRRGNTIELGPMSKAEAVGFLERALVSTTCWDAEAAGDLVQALGFVPLAIGLAAAYIRAASSRISLRMYLNKIQEGDRAETSQLACDAGGLLLGGGASNRVLTACRISFDRICAERPSAAGILALMSLLGRHRIPSWVMEDERLSDGTSSINDSWSESESDSTSGSDRDIMDDRIQEDLKMLQDYCLVSANEEGNEFEMHEHVWLLTRKWLEASPRHNEIQQQYFDRMTSALARGLYEKDWSFSDSLILHAQAALDYRPNESGVEQWAALLHESGWYGQLQGRYDVAEKMASKARTAWEERFGKTDKNALESASLLASVMNDQGRWDEAKKQQVEVMEAYVATLGLDHPDTLKSMNSLGLTLWRQGRWEEVEKLLVKVMESHKAKLGPDHPQTLRSMINLAVTYNKLGRWNQVEQLLVKTMKSYKAELGPDHPQTLTSMGGLVMAYSKQGLWDKAEKLLVMVVDIRRATLGPDHPDTLAAEAKLALLYKKLGRQADAMARK